MARVSARALRTRAREAMLSAGGRGFMRFAPAGGALLATDALRRCADAMQRAELIAALEAAGFSCSEQEGLLLLTPQDALLSAAGEGMPCVDWASPLYDLQALAVRWIACRPEALSAAGRQLIMETLRLTWQQTEQLIAGENALRARAAAMLRRGDRSGMHEAGWILYDFCREESQ